LRLITNLSRNCRNQDFKKNKELSIPASKTCRTTLPAPGSRYASKQGVDPREVKIGVTVSIGIMLLRSLTAEKQEDQP
jgi:hypothetical protein